MKMDHLSGYLLAVLLGVTSAGLIVWHVRTWRRLRQEGLADDRERDFRLRQFRRRVQTSAMLGLLGAAVLGGELLMDAAPSWKFKVIYWIGVLALVLWIALLAIADMAATSFYYSREKTDFVLQHAKLQAELRKAREEEDAPAQRQIGTQRPRRRLTGCRMDLRVRLEKVDGPGGPSYRGARDRSASTNRRLASASGSSGWISSARRYSATASAYRPLLARALPRLKWISALSAALPSARGTGKSPPRIGGGAQQHPQVVVRLVTAGRS